jgi:putative transposase
MKPYVPADSFIYRALEVRLYPNDVQKELIEKTLGCCRFIYNQSLAERIETYRRLKDDKVALRKHKYLSEKQYKEKFEFLKEVDSTALMQKGHDLRKAYDNFFKSLSGKRKGPRMGFPAFKKKRYGDSYRTVGFKADLKDKSIKLLKLKSVKFRQGTIKEWYFSAKLKSVTVKKSPSGKYFASLLYEGIDDRKKRGIKDEYKVIGLDMGLTSLYVDSNGNVPSFQKQFVRNHEKLALAQKRLSRKSKGSRNYQKARVKVARVHEKIANCRKDISRKAAASLVKEYDVIGIEDLNLNGMKRHNHGKSVTDVAWGMFVNHLTQKAGQEGKIVHKVSRWFPSSKTCSCCGTIKSDLLLSDRSWTCTCGTSHNRDLNAAINIRNETIRNLMGSEGSSTSVEMDTSGRLKRSSTINETETSIGDGRKSISTYD